MPDLAIGASTITATVTTHAVAVECHVAQQNLSLDAGRWLVTLSLSSTPARTAGKATTVQIDQTLASPGTVTIPVTRHWVYRDVEQNEAGTLHGRLDVQKWDGTKWTGWQAASFTEAVPAAVPNPSIVRGGDINFLPSSRPQSSFDWAFARHVERGITRIRVSFTALWLWYGLSSTAAQWTTAPAGGAGSFNAGAVAAFNAYLNAAAAAGLQVWCQTQTLFVPTAWGASSSQVLTSGGVSFGHMNQATLDVFIPAFLAEFGDRLYGVGIGNEPNHSDAFAPAAGVGALQGRFYDEVKSHDPTMKVIMGEIAFGDTVYAETMLDNGAAGKYDAISFHPYNLNFDIPGAATGIWTNPRHALPLNENWTQYRQYGIPVTLAEFNKMLTARGDTTSKLWLTEFGYAASMGNTVPRLNLTEEQVMDWLPVEIRQASADPRVEVVQPFRYDRDSGVGNTWTTNFGAFDHYHRPKARVAAYAALWS